MKTAVIWDMYETLITHYESPVYFGTQIAQDVGVNVTSFVHRWNELEQDRSVGKYTFEEVLKLVMEENDCYTEERFQMAAVKRIHAKRECFSHLHSEILPTLSALKERGIKIGLISNCFSEEAMLIRESELFPFFDAACMSFEQGIRKPDHEIFTRCMEMLQVEPYDCLYVGDGGSQELETASELGMKALQAVWYLKEGTRQPAGRKEDFPNLETPSEVLNYL